MDLIYKTNFPKQAAFLAQNDPESLSQSYNSPDFTKHIKRAKEAIKQLEQPIMVTESIVKSQITSRYLLKPTHARRRMKLSLASGENRGGHVKLLCR